MAKVHSIEKELSEALELKRKSGESDKSFQKRLHEAATSCEEVVWENLSDQAQAWVNAVTDYHDDKRDYPKDYDDVEPVEEEKPKGKSKTKGKAKEEEEEPETKSEEEEEDVSAKKSTSKGGKKAPEKSSKKSPAKAEKKAPSKSASSGEKGYKGHRAGSRKEAIHREYDAKGADAAMKMAAKKDIKEASARSWIGSWGGFKKK